MSGENTDKTAVRLALIGAGYWGKNLLRNFAALGALKAVCEQDPGLLETRKKENASLSALFTVSLDEVLRDPDIDAVAVATPAATHFDVCRRAIEAGKHVFVEKPVTLKIAHAKKLIGLAERKKRVLMVGHILQYHPGIVKLDGLIKSGSLGEVWHVSSRRMNFGKIRSEENVLWSFAPHDISVLLRLAGAFPRRISSHAKGFLRKHIQDQWSVDCVFPSGMTGHIDVSWLNPVKEQKLVVVGSRQMALFDDTLKENKLMLYPVNLEWKEKGPEALKTEGVPVPFDSSEPLKNECSHFLDCVRTGQRPLTDGQEGLRVLEFLTRAGKNNEFA